MLKNIIKQLGDEELIKAFEEIENANNTGELIKDGIVRSVYDKFLRIQDLEPIEYPISIIKNEIIYEIAERWYTLKKEELKNE